VEGRALACSRRTSHLLLPCVLALLVACGGAPRRGANAASAAPATAASAAAAPAADARSRLELAARAYRDHDWAAAEPHYRALAAEMPQDADLWFKLGNIYARTERPELAVAAYRETLVRRPELTKAWFNMGVVQLRQAAASFKQMEIHVAPEDPARLQAEAAYGAILAILEAGPAAAPPAGDGGGDAAPEAPPAVDAAEEVTAATPAVPANGDAAGADTAAPAADLPASPPAAESAPQRADDDDG